jgi:hypothetical protein
MKRTYWTVLDHRLPKKLSKSGKEITERWERKSWQKQRRWSADASPQK